MNAKELLQKAKSEKFALGAFNAGNLESLKAIVQAGNKLQSPIILECSPGEVTHFGIPQIVALIRAYEKQYQIPIVLNLDHGTDPEMIKNAVDEGFDYVHFDGGKMPFEDAIKMGKELADYAHSKGVIIEGEIDHIEGSSSDHTDSSPDVDSKLYTNPEQAREFIEKTGIDVFASFVGNLHGIYAENKNLNLDLLRQIQDTIPNTYLSLHGGSGIVEEDIKKAIQIGIVKINVNSEIRISFKMVLQEVLNSSNEIAPYKFMKKPMEEMQKVVEGKIKMFGSANKI